MGWTGVVAEAEFELKAAAATKRAAVMGAIQFVFIVLDS
jgi:hypothetical protein